MRKILLVLLIIIFYCSNLKADLTNQPVNLSGCGLNFVHKAIKVTDRTSSDDLPGNAMPVTFQVTEMPASCIKIEAAYLWWTVSYKAGSPDPPTATVNNTAGNSLTVTAVKTGQGGDKCWNNLGEIGTRGFRADVTQAITGNGNYQVSVQTPQWETDGLTLLIIYRDLKADYEGHIIVNDGLITLGNGDYSQTLTGFKVCETSNTAFGFMVVSDIQRSVGKSVNFNLNGTPLTTTRNFWNSEVVATSVAQDQAAATFSVSAGNDCYSWIMMGLYYQSKNCKTCPDKLPLTIKASSAEICNGSSATLSASGGATYEWTSIPAGFTSTKQNPVVSPIVTTRYIVHGYTADGCLDGWDTTMVIVNPIPMAYAGKDTITCSGEPVRIGLPAQGGSPPYTYAWSPPGGLSSTNSATVTATVTDTTKYFVTVTDSKGCINRDTVIVYTLPLPQPKITVIGKDSICVCDSVILDAGNKGYVDYQWYHNSVSNPISKLRQIVVKMDSGDYFVRVIDTNGCKNTSRSQHITLIIPQTSVGLEGQFKAEPGKTIDVQLVIRQASNLDFCHASHYRATISFNKSMLAPVGNTPTGTVNGAKRTIELTGVRIGNEPILAKMQFMSALGDSDISAIKIESFSWEDCDFVVTRVDSAFYSDNLCREGGVTRLYFGNGFSSAIDIKPNPLSTTAQVTFSVPENGLTRIYLIDMLGRKTNTLIEKEFTAGAYNFELDTKDIPSGIYYMIMQTPTEVKSQMMEVQK